MATSPAISKPAFLGFATDAADVETLRGFAASKGWSREDVHQGDISAAAHYLKNHPSPEVLLVELPSADAAPALLDALADVCDPDTKVITIGAINEYSFYCWLVDIGISSYLLRPLTDVMLENAYVKSLAPPASLAKEGKAPGKVIALMGARGGVGATAMALNLSGLIAEQSSKNVALVDIDPYGGSIALALDVEPSRGLRDVLEKPDRIDALFIDRVMMKVGKHLSVLSAEEILAEKINVHDQAGEILLRELRAKFDIIVLDLPHRLDTLTLECLKRADQVVIVSELTLLSLRDTLRLSDLMRESFKRKAPHILINRMGAAPKHEIPAGDFEKGIGAKIDVKIAYAPDFFMRVGSDIPAVKNKTNPVIKPLAALASLLLPEVKVPVEAGKKSLGFFGGKK